MHGYQYDVPSLKITQDDLVDSSLSAIFRKVFCDSGITEMEMQDKITKYVADKLPKTKSEAIAMVSNIKKEMISNNMSWDLFRRNADILGFKQIQVHFLA